MPLLAEVLVSVLPHHLGAVPQRVARHILTAMNDTVAANTATTISARSMLRMVLCTA